MRRQPLADLRHTLASVSLHGQRPPPQDAPLLEPEHKSLLKGKAHQCFGMRGRADASPRRASGRGRVSAQTF